MNHVCDLKNQAKRVIPSQYFLMGLMVGLIVGITLILPFNDSAFSFFQFKNNQEVYVDMAAHNESDHDASTNKTLADRLYNEVKVLCWIMTGPKNHKTKAIHVKATWGKRCNILLFMSTEKDSSLPSIALPVIENRANLWGKTKEASKYVYKNYFNKADWFFKADDDTYTIMENMRYMLHYHNTTDPVYFGFRFKKYVKQGYMSGGSGYVLSKEALKRFVTDSLPDPKKCKEANTGAEDVEIGKCLAAVGVEAGDSRDTHGRSSFIPLYASNLLFPGRIPKNTWFWSYNYYPFEEGLECCSDSLISIHYVSPENLYLLEYLIYHVTSFGLSYNSTLDAVVFESNVNKTVLNRNNTFTTDYMKTKRPDNYP